MIFNDSMIKAMLTMAVKSELRDALYRIAPQIDPEIVDIFGEVAAWNKQRLEQEKAGQVLRFYRPYTGKSLGDS